MKDTAREFGRFESAVGALYELHRKALAEAVKKCPDATPTSAALEGAMIYPRLRLLN